MLVKKHLDISWFFLGSTRRWTHVHMCVFPLVYPKAAKSWCCATQKKRYPSFDYGTFMSIFRCPKNEKKSPVCKALEEKTDGRHKPVEQCNRLKNPSSRIQHRGIIMIIPHNSQYIEGSTTATIITNSVFKVCSVVCNFTVSTLFHTFPRQSWSYSGIFRDTQGRNSEHDNPNKWPSVFFTKQPSSWNGCLSMFACLQKSM